MSSHEMSLTTIMGMLVLTAALSAIVSNFVKEKLFPRLTANGNHKRESGLCPYHYQVTEKMESTLKTFKQLAEDIKIIERLYHELDKKITVFIATGQEKFESVQEVVTAVNQLKGEIKQLNMKNWKGDNYT